jgi:hypothetical protein
MMGSTPESAECQLAKCFLTQSRGASSDDLMIFFESSDF